ncbi:alpha/beta fold hydrolase [Terrihabitans sp. B22-R8]|uniref:alpha/beta fold hydrolase n=1 Tax=Terrihabitans sp. B22-R8 TaxID=3425128 RepID=UPI00403C1389
MTSFLSDGLTLNYRDEGEGDPVLLIHGFASNLQTNWSGTGWIKALVDAGYRVVAFDHRGHGDSAKIYDSSRYSIRDMALDALTLLDRLNIKRADIIGYSMGARVGALMAIEHADRVRSLVIGGMGDRLFEGAPKSAEIAEALEAAHRDDVSDPYARTFRVFAEATKSDLAALAAVIRSPRMPLLPEQLAQIGCPVLIAVGTEDDVAGSSAKLASCIPGAQVLDVPGRDHNRTVGDKVFKSGVIDFLSKRP